MKMVVTKDRDYRPARPWSKRSRTRRGFAPLTLLAVLVCACGCGGPEISGFAKVSDTLYRGGQPTERGYAELKRMGIKTVVSLRVFDTNGDDLERYGLRHVHISFKHVNPEDEDVIAFLKVVTDPENLPVFVHCRQGEDRTGMMVAIYRMVLQGWPKNKAMKEMKQMGFNEIWEPIEDYLEEMDVARIKRLLRNPTFPK